MIPTTTKRVSLFVVALVTIFAAPNTQASLVGDSINARIGAPGAGIFFEETNEVGDWVEFTWGDADFSIDIDVHADSFDITFNLDNVPSSNLPISVFLEDLQWVGMDGTIVGVTQTSGAPANFISAGADSIIVGFPIVNAQPQTHQWSFDIETRHVPDAGASALFIGMGLIPILGATARKRN